MIWLLSWPGGWRAPSSPSMHPVAKINGRQKAGVPSSCRHPPTRRPPGRFKSSRFSHFPNVISGNCWRKERRCCRKSNPRVDIVIHIMQRQDSVCARRGSEGAPSPPRTVPAFQILARELLCTSLTFTELFLKQPQEQSRCWDMLPRVPRVSPRSCNAQSTSTYQITAAGLVLMLPSGFKASPRASQCGCVGPRSPENYRLTPGVCRAPCKHCHQL